MVIEQKVFKNLSIFLEEMAFSGKVYEIIRKIPKGRVTTYKEIARKLRTKAYRAVGTALRNNKYPAAIPCHRVVKSNGSLGGYCGIMNSRTKKDLLKKEGVDVKKGKIVDFEKKFFKLR